MLRNYKDLQVWNKAMDLVRQIYLLTKQLPKTEQFGLVSQMQRSAVSIPSNIAEGYARKGTGEYLRFLSIAYGSAAELETQLLILIQEYPNLNSDECLSQVIIVQKMLYNLMRKIEAFSR